MKQDCTDEIVVCDCCVRTLPQQDEFTATEEVGQGDVSPCPNKNWDREKRPPVPLSQCMLHAAKNPPLTASPTWPTLMQSPTTAVVGYFLQISSTYGA